VCAFVDYIWYAREGVSRYIRTHASFLSSFMYREEEKARPFSHQTLKAAALPERCHSSRRPPKSFFELQSVVPSNQKVPRRTIWMGGSKGVWLSASEVFACWLVACVGVLAALGLGGFAHLGDWLCTSPLSSLSPSHAHKATTHIWRTNLGAQPTSSRVQTPQDKTLLHLTLLSPTP